MSVRRNKRDGYWMIDFVMAYPDGSKERVRKKSTIQTKRDAEAEERMLRNEKLYTWNRRRDRRIPEKEVPTFDEWFNGPFWSGWVVSRKNKHSEIESKLSIYKFHLKPVFGELQLDDIADGFHIDEFRGSLVRKNLSEKRINNILAVLSKALRYAEDKRVIDRAPKVGMFKIEQPEIEWWDFEEYTRLVRATFSSSIPDWHLVTCLAGEAGLRIGEIRALLWERDIDMIAQTITVNEQRRKGVTGTPKGRTRRTIPMTPHLYLALKRVQGIRGYVVRNSDGTPLNDDQTKSKIYTLCRQAGLPERGWHVLRHSFATHAAMFGINPWTLMNWLGHKNITQTMRYVHTAKNRVRPIPFNVLREGDGERDPDRKVILMLGARMAAIRQQTTATSLSA